MDHDEGLGLKISLSARRERRYVGQNIGSEEVTGRTVWSICFDCDRSWLELGGALVHRLRRGYTIMLS